MIEDCVAAIKQRFELDAPRQGQNGTTTLRQELKAIAFHAKKRGQPIPRELAEEREFPERARHVLDWFWELNTSRQYGFGHPQAIPYSEILAWSTLRNMRVKQWELTLLKSLDREYLDAQARAMPDAKGDKGGSKDDGHQAAIGGRKR